MGGGGGGSRCCSLARRTHCGSGDRRAPQAAFPVAPNLGHCLDRVLLGRLILLEALGGVPGAEGYRRLPPKHEEGVKQEPPQGFTVSTSLSGTVFWGRGFWGGTLPHWPERREWCVRSSSPAKVTGMGAPPPRRPPPPFAGFRAPAAHPPADLGAEGDGSRRERRGLGCGERPKVAPGGERLRVSPEMPPPERPCPAPTICPRASWLSERLQHGWRRSPCATCRELFKASLGVCVFAPRVYV